MNYRTTSYTDIERAVSQYATEITGFDPSDWSDNLNNWALSNDNGDIALFEYEYDGVYSGHYFFFSRGKEAVKAAKSLLKSFWTMNEDAKVIRGLTPLENLGARWMNKQLKFKSYGVIKTSVGPCELVILTKEEWRINNE